MTFHRCGGDPTKQDWIDLIGVYRTVVRARTGHRFRSLEWAR